MYTKLDEGGTDMSIIKTSDEATYIYAMIKQGLEELSYNVTAFVEADDLYGATAVAKDSIIVNQETEIKAGERHDRRSRWRLRES